MVAPIEWMTAPTALPAMTEVTESTTAEMIASTTLMTARTIAPTGSKTAATIVWTTLTIEATIAPTGSKTASDNRSDRVEDRGNYRSDRIDNRVDSPPGAILTIARNATNNDILAETKYASSFTTIHRDTTFGRNNGSSD